MEETTTTIMAALATLPPLQLSNLTHTIFSAVHRHRRRLSALLSSPILFSLTLRRLHLLSLPSKTLLIAKHLLSSLHNLTLHFHSTTTTTTTTASSALNLQDYDAVLLLLLLCEVRQYNPEILNQPPSKWREVLSQFYMQSLLSGSSIGVYNGSVLVPYIEMVMRCLRFVKSFESGRKVGREAAASAAAVVALPSVEVIGGGVECVICREEMEEGRDVCGLPCQHLFHWKCVLPWLKKRNTCPCCRFQLPTDDVFGEIQRLWEVLIKVGKGYDAECIW
ncbi:hypothetical protein UlMin_005944 [Ulmus minor]